MKFRASVVLIVYIFLFIFFFPFASRSIKIFSSILWYKYVYIFRSNQCIFKRMYMIREKIKLISIDVNNNNNISFDSKIRGIIFHKPRQLFSNWRKLEKFFFVHIYTFIMCAMDVESFYQFLKFFSWPHKRLDNYNTCSQYIRENAPERKYNIRHK